jgi:anti-sigma B factor antagonist
MSLVAKMKRDSQGNIVVHMQGDLNYEHSIPLRDELQSLIRQHPNTPISIDLSQVDFVGSSGIGHFVETLKLIKIDQRSPISLEGVQKEFIKVFKLYGMEEVDELIAAFDFEDITSTTVQLKGFRPVTKLDS